MRIRKNQYGLASVEMCLIMPVVVMMMYIMLHSAKTMLTYEKRVIEARNAAYTVELYSGGDVTLLDEKRQEADEWVQDKEETIISGMEALNPALEFLQTYAGIDLADHLDNPAYLDILQKFPIQRYATVSDESDWFYKSMLRVTLDEMDDYHEGDTWGESTKDDPFIVQDPRTIGLYEILKHDYSKSRLTVGVSVSPFVGALGKFHPFTGRFFMRSYHAADFSKKLDLHDITINKQEVITGGYDLKQGYSKEMESMLNPVLLFKDLFADGSVQPLPTPDFIPIDIPVPVDPTVGIIDNNQDYLDSLSDEDRALAQAYADKVNANVYWEWSQIDPSLTGPQQSRIRNIAKRAGLIPHIPVEAGTRYADFSTHIYQNRDTVLPPEYFDQSIDDQEDYLNNLYGPQPAGTTWHHHQDSGRMQLVYVGVHRAYGHRGGCTTWATNCGRG